MRRDFAVLSIYETPPLSNQIEGMGEPTQEVEPNATSTACERGDGIELKPRQDPLKELNMA